MSRILVVDDDPLVREAIATMASRAGHDVVEAENGAVALDHHRSQPADIVILDVIMPVMEGIETIRALRERDPGVKIIAISGNNPSGDGLYLKYASSLGAHAALAKPFRNSELLDCIDALAAQPAKAGGTPPPPSSR
jgi:CheY-like chemotaxis protein